MVALGSLHFVYMGYFEPNGRFERVDMDAAGDKDDVRNKIVCIFFAIWMSCLGRCFWNANKLIRPYDFIDTPFRVYIFFSLIIVGFGPWRISWPEKMYHYTYPPVSVTGESPVSPNNAHMYDGISVNLPNIKVDESTVAEDTIGESLASAHDETIAQPPIPISTGNESTEPFSSSQDSVRNEDVREDIASESKITEGISTANLDPSKTVEPEISIPDYAVIDETSNESPVTKNQVPTDANVPENIVIEEIDETLAEIPILEEVPLSNPAKTREVVSNNSVSEENDAENAVRRNISSESIMAETSTRNHAPEKAVELEMSIPDTVDETSKETPVPKSQTRTDANESENAILEGSYENNVFEQAEMENEMPLI
jgi:hypothetical protein